MKSNQSKTRPTHKDALNFSDKPRLEIELFDTHCHLDFAELAKDLPNHLKMANNVGVKRFLVPATSEDNWQQVQALSAKYPMLYHALGFHPHFLPPIDQALLQPKGLARSTKSLTSLIDPFIHQLDKALASKSEHCVAIGEIGLDGMILDRCPMDVQVAFLTAQIDLANQYQLPVLLHARKAHNEISQVLKRLPCHKGGIVHAFSGSLSQANYYLSKGFKIGVGGVISYPNAKKTQATIAALPLDSLVIETDSPDMPLADSSSNVNFPFHTATIFRIICCLRNETPQTISKMIWQNSNGILAIK